jgi:hypothetical protein
MHTACASHMRMRPLRAARTPHAPRRITYDSQPKLYYILFYSWPCLLSRPCQDLGSMNAEVLHV